MILRSLAHRWGWIVLATALAACEVGATDTEPPATSPARLGPMRQVAKPVELAPYMGELQRLTHKLSLSVAASNPKLAGFYAYESIELLREIQTDVPEYDGQPIAVFIDRMALPPAERVAEAAREMEKHGDPVPLREAHRDLIASCNACHQATLHGFIKITDGREVNPFNQDFAP